MSEIFTTKRICRAGIIAALYIALTCSFGMLGYVGILQFRPAEALCILPLFYVEAVPALFIGCMLSNVFSMYGVADIFGGSAVTLIAALLTYLVGRLFRESKDRGYNHVLRVGLGGLPPVLMNALIIPVIIVYIGGFTEGFGTTIIAYAWNCLSLFVSQSVWIYALGTPLYLLVYKMRKKNVSVFLDGRRTPANSADPAVSAMPSSPESAKHGKKDT